MPKNKTFATKNGISMTMVWSPNLTPNNKTTVWKSACWRTRSCKSLGGLRKRTKTLHVKVLDAAWVHDRQHDLHVPHWCHTFYASLQTKCPLSSNAVWWMIYASPPKCRLKPFHNTVAHSDPATLHLDFVQGQTRLDFGDLDVVDNPWVCSCDRGGNHQAQISRLAFLTIDGRMPRKCSSRRFGTCPPWPIHHIVGAPTSSPSCICTLTMSSTFGLTSSPICSTFAMADIARRSHAMTHVLPFATKRLHD